MKRIVVIGSGLGGLECGILLAERGYEVTILEQAAHIGGCLQSYVRHGVELDTGFHYVGGIEPGQVFYPVFHHLGLDSLPWTKLDKLCADRVVLPQMTVDIPQGYDAFLSTLGDLFPADKSALQRYVDLMQDISDRILNLQPSPLEYWETGAFDYLQRSFASPALRDVLAGASMRLDLNPASLPLYAFACINNSFIQSAYRLDGGGQMIAQHLAARFAQNGGQIITSAQVTRIAVEQGHVTGVCVNHRAQQIHTPDDFIPADILISDISPVATLDLLPDKAVRPLYARRMRQLEHTNGVLTTTLILRPNQLPYRNFATHIHACSPWQNDDDAAHIMIHQYPHRNAIDLMTQTHRPWANMRDNDPQAYRHDKKQVAELMIAAAEKHLPGLTDAAEQVLVSTPATYQRFLLMPQGAAYGIRKDYRDTMTSLLSPRTPVQGLFLTGQNLALHGLLGVSMTAQHTVNEALNMLSTHLI